jgi:hypothetical protein
VLARCPACSERFPVAGSSKLACPFCGANVEVLVERSASDPIEPSPADEVKKAAGTPWEERGLLRGFLLTIWSVMTSPAAFFRNLGSLSIGGAPSFALLILSPAVFVQASAFFYLKSSGPIDAEALVRYAGLVVLASTLSVAYLGTFYQLAASVMTGRRIAIPATVRALCFGFAPMVLAIVPVAGFVVGLSWSLILHAIALREIHGLGLIKSLAVVAAPIAVVAVRLW